MKAPELVLEHGRIMTWDGGIPDGFVRVDARRIVQVGRMDELPDIDNARHWNVDGDWILPGFIDIHVNGGGGHLAVEGTCEAIREMARAHARAGTTSVLPTTISVEHALLEKTLDSIAQVMETQGDWANVLGAHLEGPFLNPARAGAHRKEHLEAPSIETLDSLLAASKQTVRVLSLAPELEGSLPLIEHAVKAGVIVGLAHSDADYDVTRQAIDAGMCLCTHLFNAMPPLLHRSPGPIGAFLTTPGTWVELIADGQHILPPVMQVAIRAKGSEGVILVTDAVTPAATEMRSFEIFGLELQVKGRSCYTADGSLAGSALTMAEAVRVIAEKTETSLEDAVRMASLNPARLLGLDNVKGSIAAGLDADLVVADDHIRIVGSVVAGRVMVGL